MYNDGTLCAKRHNLHTIGESMNTQRILRFLIFGISSAQVSVCLGSAAVMLRGDQYAQLHDRGPYNESRISADEQMHWKNQFHKSQYCESTIGPDGSVIAYVRHDQSVWVFDMDIRAHMHIQAGGRTVRAVTFNTQGDLLLVWEIACPGDPGMVRIYSGRLLMRQYYHYSRNVVPCFTKDGRHVLCCPDNGNKISLIDIEVNQEVCTFEHKGEGMLLSAFLNSDGTKLVTCTCGGSIKVWDVFPGRVLFSRWHGISELVQAQFAPDGDGIVFSGPGFNETLWLT
jgi:WD40 repeat protein